MQSLQPEHARSWQVDVRQIISLAAVLVSIAAVAMAAISAGAPPIALKPLTSPEVLVVAQ